MKMPKRLLSLFLAAALLIGLPWPVSSRADSAAITVMVYMCGSNLESGSGAATKDINEMLKSGNNRDLVNVLVMAGGSTYWMSGFSAQKTAIYDVGGKRPKNVWESDAVSMGDADTLLTLLDFAYESYPAEKYALILWDHGGGPLHGCCSDSLFSDSLSLEELENALSRSAFSQRKLEWLGFDACLMASLEIASAVAPYARYMVASQESEPGSGWDYRFLKGIEADRSGAATARRIIDSYFDSLSGYSGDLTLSCLDLTQIGKISSLVGQVYENLASDMSADTLADFSGARSSAVGFGRSAEPGQDYDLVDLLGLTERYAALERVGVWQIRNALNRAVVYNRSTIDGTCGISIYHPYRNTSAYRKNSRGTLTSSFAPLGYRRYLYRFSQLLMDVGTTLDWSELEPSSYVISATNSQRFSIRLTEEQRNDFLSARFMVFARPVADAPEQAPMGLMFSNADVSLSVSGFLSGRYYGSGLYFCSAETGEILAGPLLGAQAMAGGEYVLPVYPDVTGDTAPGNAIQLWYSVDENNDLNLKTAQIYDPVMESYTPRQDLALSGYPSLFFPNQRYFPRKSDEGYLLGLSLWQPYTDNIQGWKLDNTDWQLSFRIVPPENMEFFAGFEITDIYNNTYMTELAPVDPRVFGT